MFYLGPKTLQKKGEKQNKHKHTWNINFFVTQSKQRVVTIEMNTTILWC